MSLISKNYRHTHKKKNNKLPCVMMSEVLLVSRFKKDFTNGRGLLYKHYLELFTSAESSKPVTHIHVLEINYFVAS